MIRYADYKRFDVLNGEGFRNTLFVTGCTHHCKGCFNKKLWDFNQGKLFTEEVQNRIITDCKDPKICGLSILGGEPFDNLEGLIPFVEKYKKQCGKSLWVWTGYLYEDLIKDCNSKKLLQNIDVLIDGQYKQELRDLTLKFRGSSNQRIIFLNRE